MTNYCDIEKGDNIYLYHLDFSGTPTVTCEKFVVEFWWGGGLLDIISDVTQRKHTRSIKNLDEGISAVGKEGVYIWLSSPDEKKAYEITKKYYCDKLVKVSKEANRLTKIFKNMGEWEAKNK